MKLGRSISLYVRHKQAIGMRFQTEARTLKSFCKFIGNVPLTDVSREEVLSFLKGRTPISRFWERKHTVLKGFYKFAIARGFVNRSPLPLTIAKPQTIFVPYIYSRAELRRLFDAIPAIDNCRCLIAPDTFRILLLVLYGTGLRIGEALSLRISDIDFRAGTLLIRESKFYKTRLLPIGKDLLCVLKSYVKDRPNDNDGPAFQSRHSKKISLKNAECAFVRLRHHAGIARGSGNSRNQPRLHDLRATFAVHRLVSWYRNGEDVQTLLPQLSTYLGHAHISGTQRYLTLIPELLGEASIRFERYAMRCVR